MSAPQSRGPRPPGLPQGAARGRPQEAARETSDTERIRAQALALGFAACGFTGVERLPHGAAFQQWIDAGMAGSMDYLRRTRHQRADPRALLASARAAIVVAATYSRAESPILAQGRPQGAVARFAHGEDYHRVLKRRLAQLAEWINEHLDAAAELRAAVDTAPLFERELAMAAGLGFIGKNTLLISPGLGSFTVLGVLLTSQALVPDRPARARCGRCTLCLRACPTTALVGPYQLDARRCISYLTIEQREPVDPALRGALGRWAFGCDLCQEVCPYNRPTPRSRALAPDPALAPHDPLTTLDLAATAALTSAGYRRLVAGRALARAPRRCLQRNAALSAGNHPAVSPALDAALAALCQPEAAPLARQAALWAIGAREARGLVARPEPTGPSLDAVAGSGDDPMIPPGSAPAIP
ncbi:MAG: tRNA epoxyqueuosine(34) reductase QueG [Proteobacteria bacterium]|nr:tRNA epoxyqueuosine(34) reductase QueG [Pseudomonadota bacterium]